MIALPEPAYDLSPLRPGETGDLRQARKIATFQPFSISVFWHSLTHAHPGAARPGHDAHQLLATYESS